MSDDPPASNGRWRRAFDRIPKRARITGIVVAASLVAGAVAVPVTASAIDGHRQRVAAEVRIREAAAERRVAAEAADALAAARAAAEEFDVGFEGFGASLGDAVAPDAVTTLEDARADLADAIEHGGPKRIAAALAALRDAFDALVASAAGPAETLLAASPLADPSTRDELTAAIAALDTAEDAKAALARVKQASDAVAAAQASAQAAADAAAAEQAAAEEASWGGGTTDPAPASPADECEDEYCEPGVLDMYISPFPDCSGKAGQTVYSEFRWQSRRSNTTDVSYALTDTDRVATEGFILIAGDQPEYGTVWIPRTCPPEGEPLPYLTVMLISRNDRGSQPAWVSGF